MAQKVSSEQNQDCAPFGAPPSPFMPLMTCKHPNSRCTFWTVDVQIFSGPVIIIWASEPCFASKGFLIQWHHAVIIGWGPGKLVLDNQATDSNAFNAQHGQMAYMIVIGPKRLVFGLNHLYESSCLSSSQSRQAVWIQAHLGWDVVDICSPLFESHHCLCQPYLLAKSSPIATLFYNVKACEKLYLSYFIICYPAHHKKGPGRIAPGQPGSRSKSF